MIGAYSGDDLENLDGLSWIRCDLVLSDPTSLILSTTKYGTPYLGVNNNNILGASIYAAGGSSGGNISLGLLSNRALITSTASGLSMHTSSMLQVDSTTQGFLPPRTNLTSNISTPAQGLMTYLTGSTNEGLYYYNSGSTPGWRQVADTTFVSASLSGSAGYLPVFTGANSVSSSVIFQSGERKA